MDTCASWLLYLMISLLYNARHKFLLYAGLQGDNYDLFVFQVILCNVAMPMIILHI